MEVVSGEPLFTSARSKLCRRCCRENVPPGGEAENKNTWRESCSILSFGSTEQTELSHIASTSFSTDAPVIRRGDTEEQIWTLLIVWLNRFYNLSCDAGEKLEMSVRVKSGGEETVMSAPDRGLIDFRALEKELRGSLRSEEKYQRENAAKLRAVNQRVGSYDEFRSLVLASHLKPLEKHDLQGAPRKQPWNPVSAGNGTRHMTSGSPAGNQVKSEDQTRTRTRTRKNTENNQ
ncbi:hypothetical protein WMY93_000035 [Mugilogobius chulae]|uniref:Dynein attachment factor N-terminal domain-containing protein n=1 Tax=Mugilogobius chulae TaxID=88201 RepID=A0AAW0Q8W6_9GOBI